MRLKKLEIHGYKTFAGKTEFAFDQGVTAIVGPNGSGKSNVADCVRWVLGEQRVSAMRAKKSEDMIFNGTEKRARLGMAQGFLTIDNSDESLPLDFSEIVIGRRIYRSGENEYLINGQRVRLRDIQELLGHAGIGASTYTVIGQGLIDAALALRAEERRQLIEDAAGLGAYQGKRDEALRRLDQTQDNLTRARDIVAELEPQLRRLKRQAERAEEYLAINGTLQALMRQWYGFRWGQAAQQRHLDQERVSLTGNELQAATLDVQSIEKRLEGVRQRQQQLQQQLEGSRRERGRLRAESERLRRERAVAQERARLLARQVAESGRELEASQAEEAAVGERLAALRAEGERLQETRQRAQAALTEAEQALAAAAGTRDALRAALDRARRELAQGMARQGELTQRQAQAAERRQQLTQEREAHLQALSELESQVAGREREIATIRETLDGLAERHNVLHQERRAVLSTRSEAQTAQREAEGHLRQTDKALDAVRTRQELLGRLRREGGGYEAAVRGLLNAAASNGNPSGRLSGIIGPVANLLQVPDELSVAITAALGERLQAVVVADEEAADAARQWLQAREVGRAVLLPLSRLRQTEPAPEPHLVVGGNGNSAGAPAAIRAAAALVRSDEPSLLDALLGGWAIVDDWTAAREAVAAGWHAVTSDGQVWRRDGRIAAGRGKGTGSELLAQSREWAALPAQLQASIAAQAEAQAALERATATVREQEGRLAALDRDIAEIGRQRQRAEQALQRERRDAEKLQQEQEWRRGLIGKASQELEALGLRVAALAGEMEALAIQQAAGEAAVAQAERDYEAADPGTRRATVEQARTQVALAAERLTNWQRAQREQSEALARLVQRRSAREKQSRDLLTEQEALETSTGLLDEEAERAAAAEAALGSQMAPLERNRQQAEEEQLQLEERFATARQRRREREEAAHTARLALQAAEDRLQHLRDQIEADLGMVEMAEVAEELPHQAVLPWNELVTTLPKVAVLADGVEDDIRRLRRRLGQIGAVNPNAPTEHQELATRYDFLVSQSADLEKASADLKQVVAELDALMRQRFTATFDAINTEFKTNFTRLFGGGKAHLELTDPENISSTGIDIVARPPGKRPQSIALLSGGERALTAVALIFAILRVSPAPFCVLDEVDAMLDEANVGRFRDMLQEMAQETQFIVITHNRGTIEASRDIYGISQAESGVSEVVSLALEAAVRLSKH